VQQGGRSTRETLLNRCTARHLDLELRDAHQDVPRHHFGEERPLVFETRIDSALSRTGDLRDLVDACALEPAQQKKPYGPHQQLGEFRQVRRRGTS
jgi:hypothetical protein